MRVDWNGSSELNNQYIDPKVQKKWASFSGFVNKYKIWQNRLERNITETYSFICPAPLQRYDIFNEYSINC